MRLLTLRNILRLKNLESKPKHTILYQQTIINCPFQSKAAFVSNPPAIFFYSSLGFTVNMCESSSVSTLPLLIFVSCSRSFLQLKNGIKILLMIVLLSWYRAACLVKANFLSSQVGFKRFIQTLLELKLFICLKRFYPSIQKSPRQANRTLINHNT